MRSIAKLGCLLGCLWILLACDDMVRPDDDSGCRFPQSLQATQPWKDSFGQNRGWACLRVEWADGMRGARLVRVDREGQVFGQNDAGDLAFLNTKVSLPGSHGRAGLGRVVRLLALGLAHQKVDPRPDPATACVAMAQESYTCDREPDSSCWMEWRFAPKAGAPGVMTCSFLPANSPGSEVMADGRDGDIRIEPTFEWPPEGKPEQSPEHGPERGPDVSMEPLSDAGPDIAPDAADAGPDSPDLRDGGADTPPDVPLVMEPAPEPQIEPVMEPVPEPVIEPIQEVADAGARDRSPEPLVDAGVPEPQVEFSWPDTSVDRGVPEQPVDTLPDSVPQCRHGVTESCYTGPVGALGRGDCVAGTRTCSAGTWGPCGGSEVLPIAEVCGNGKDDDCNGVVDDGPGCTPTCAASSAPFSCVVTVAGPPDVSWGDVKQPWLRIPFGVARDERNGRVYIADSGHHRILVYEPNLPTAQQISVLAGTGFPGYRNGQALQALFKDPRGLALRMGVLYVADTENHVIRAIDLQTRQVSLIAGTPGKFGLVTSTTATLAEFSQPRNIAFDTTGKMYIADTANHRVQVYDPATSMVTTLAGNGHKQPFAWPSGIVVTGTPPVVYLADRDRHVIRKIDANKAVTIVAGQLDMAGSAGGDATTNAKLNLPEGLAFADGVLYIADSSNRKIRTLGMSASTVDDLLGVGSGATTFQYPAALTVSSTHVYVCDRSSHRIYEFQRPSITASLTIGAEVNGKSIGSASSIRMDSPYDVAFSHSTLYWAEQGGGRVLRLDLQTDQSSELTLPALTNKVTPRGISVGPTGDVFVSFSGNHALARYLQNTMLFTRIAGSATGVSGNPVTSPAAALSTLFDLPWGLAFGSQGALFFADSNNHKIKVLDFVNNTVSLLVGTKKGYKDGAGGIAEFDSPSALAIDTANQRLFVADTVNHCIRNISLSTQQVATLAGTNVIGTTDGVPGVARFYIPQGLAYDASRRFLYVADTGNHCIRKITFDMAGIPQLVSTVAGTCSFRNSGYTDGIGSESLFLFPRGLTLDANGDLYVADTGNHRIRKIIFK